MAQPELQRLHNEAAQRGSQIQQATQNLAAFSNVPEHELETIFELQDQATELVQLTNQLFQEINIDVEAEPRVAEARAAYDVARKSFDAQNSAYSKAQNQVRHNPNDPNTRKQLQGARLSRSSALKKSNEMQHAYWDELSKAYERSPGAAEFRESCSNLRKLHARTLSILQGASSAQEQEDAAVLAINFSEKEFQDARDHHRASARWNFGFLLTVGLAAAASFLWMFADQKDNLSDIPTARLLAAIGTRLSLVLVVGWLLVYLGRAISRHNQQAVTYQDRLAGLNAAEQVLLHASKDERREIVQHMLQTYVTLETNAFADSEREQSPLSVARPILKEVRETAKALAPNKD